MRRWHPMDLQRFSWPKPRVRLLEDRVTGTLYYLSHEGQDVVLRTPPPSQSVGRVEEPLLVAPIGRVRLYASSGALRYEVATDEVEARRDEPVFTRNFADARAVLRITADEVEEFGDPLCLTEYDGLGRTTVITSLGCNFFPVTGGNVFEDGVFESGVYL